MIRIKTTIIYVGLAVLLLCSAAFATVPWTKAFNELYSPKAEKPLKKAKCGACHVKPTGGGLNSYGKMLGKAEISAESLKAIEHKDADMDGFSNIKEIKAGTLPGDAKSKPKR